MYTASRVSFNLISHPDVIIIIMSAFTSSTCMSSYQAVAEYIHEQGGMDLLVGAACRTGQPRLAEICLGIIGNIICSREICLNSFETAEQR